MQTDYNWQYIYSRDLRSFEIRFEFESDVPIQIRFESDVPIRKFRNGRTCHVPSYHKLRSLTVQQKHQPFRRL